MEEFSKGKELLLDAFDSPWRGPCNKLGTVQEVVHWVLGYPQQATTLSSLEHEIEFVKTVRGLLADSLFLQLSDSFRVVFMESIIKILNLGPYNIVRFRCLGERHNTQLNARTEKSLIVALLNLLNAIIHSSHTSTNEGTIASCVSILELIGLLGVGGVSVRELKALLCLVADGPHWQTVLRGDCDAVDNNHILSRLRHPILKSIIGMTSFEDAQQHKARPSSLWSMVGQGSGLKLPSGGWPLNTEYAFSVWVRLQASPLQGEKAYLWDLTTDAGAGVSVYLKSSGLPGSKGAHIVVHCAEPSDNPTAEAAEDITVPDFEIANDIWYHIAVRHGPKSSSSARSGLNWLGVNKLFSKDEFVLLVDEQVVFETELSVPRNVKSKASHMTPTIGKDFNGQMGDIYIFKEAVSPVLLARLMEASNGINRGSVGPRLPPDMDPAFDSGSRRMLSEKLLAVYSPTRTSSSKHKDGSVSITAFEVHSSLHAHVVGNTFAWSFTGTDPKDVIGSLGGLRCLFPLLASLFTAASPNRLMKLPSLTKGGSQSDDNSSQRTSEASEPKSPRDEEDELDDDEEELDDDYSDDDDDDDDVVKLMSNATEVMMTCELGEPGQVDLRSSASSTDQLNKPRRRKFKGRRKTKPRGRSEEEDGVDDELSVNTEVALLLRIFARFLQDHEANQREMLRVGGVNLLSWALTRAADKGFLRKCCDKEVGRSLLQLSSSCREHPQLGRQIDTMVLFDLRIWSKASLAMQLSVLPVLVSVLRSDPAHFVPRVPLAPLLDALRHAYCRAGSSEFDKKGPPAKDFMDIFGERSPTKRRVSLFYRQTSASVSYDPVVTEWHLRAVVLTIIRIILETLTKAELPQSSGEAPKNSDEGQSEVDRTYNLIGAGWSTVSAAMYVQSMDPLDNDNFTRFMMNSRSTDASKVGGRVRATSVPSVDVGGFSNQSDHGGSLSRSSLAVKKMKDSSRLSGDMGLILQVLAECSNRACVHAVGTVLLDLLRDVKLPSRFVEAIASHFDNSWEVAATFMLTAVADHPSNSDELCALGIRLVGALLRRTYLDETGKGKRTFMGSSMGKLVGFQRKGASEVSGQRGPVLLTRQSTLGEIKDLHGSFSASELDSELSTNMALAPGYAGRTIEDEKNSENYVAVNIWCQEGGGRILYRLLKDRVKEKNKKLGNDVYGALLELTHLSDVLVSNMTSVYALTVKAALRKKMTDTDPDTPFLLTDYPQIETSLFIAPPGKDLAHQITTLFQLPRVRNTGALEALLMLLPKLPDAQQEEVWNHLSVLIGQSSNVKVLLNPENVLLLNQWIGCLFQLLKNAVLRPGDEEEETEDEGPDIRGRGRGGGGVKFAGDVSDHEQQDEEEEVEEEVEEDVIPQPEQRKQYWYELCSDRLGEIVALSIWLGPKTPRSILASVFALSQEHSRDENTRAAALRAVLSRTITSVKERSFTARRANPGWVSDAIKEKTGRWDMLVELLFVTAATCVQQTYVSVLASRSVTEALEKWIRPSVRRSRIVDQAAAAFEASHIEDSPVLARESVFAHGALVGESYLSDGCFAPIPAFIALQEDQSAADTYIALQALELFDGLLWPTSIQETYTLLTGEANKTPTGPVGLFAHQPPMLMTLIQLCLICLAGLHPADPVAFENANRIRKLVSLLLQQPTPKGAKSKSGSAAATVPEWLILVVVHIHAALRQVRHFIFSNTTSSSTDMLIELKQAACAAEQLMRVLALVVSANDEIIKQTFSTGAEDAQFSEVMLTSHVDSGRKASSATKVEGVRKAMNWLDSSWLVSQVASLTSVYNVVKKVGNEETALAENLSHSIEPVSELEWETSYGPEAEAEKRANTGKKKLMKAEIRGRKQLKRQRAAMHRSQAASWAHMSTMSRRAAWSPWMEAVPERGEEDRGDSDGAMSAAVWKLSNHRDGFGRRMLLQRNFTYGHHNDSSYNNHKHTKSSNQEPVLPTEATSSLLKKVGRLTMAPQEGDLRKMGEDEDTDEEDEDRSDDDYDSDGASLAASSHPKKSSLKSPLRNQGPKTIVKDVKSSVQLVVLGVTVPGTLVLTEFHAVFAHDPVQLEALKKKKSQGSIPPYLVAAPLTWRLDKLVEIHNRRFDLEPCAVELYFADGQDVFIAFDGKMDARRKFWKGIQHRAVTGAAALLRHVPKSRKPPKVLAEAKLTEAWRSRRITNFEYLLRLNVIAGRSFNDLSQYPVFPWIIADYNADVLDLDDIDNSKGQFRDLTRPIGALNPDRLESFVERYRDLADDDPSEAYMYGTHYSSAGIVLHFLLRQEPFTSLAIDFQGGHFDCPDRLFFNVAESWKGCTSSTSDVKEVIPEWYCFPEALLNRNHWDLGELQVGPDVSDVILPPWAKGDTKTKRAFEFVRINRKALESEYVSMNLHHWIDLIFGENQRSFEKFNVFYPLTYENAVDIEAEEDSVQREAHIAQIRHFGQTPSQIVKKAHPKRLPVNECMRPLCSSHEMIENMKFWSIPKHARPSDSKAHGSVQALIIVGDRLVSMYGDLTVNIVRWSNMPDGSGLPFTLTNRSTKVLPEKATAKSPYTLSTSEARRPSSLGTKMKLPSPNPIFGSFGICTSTGPNASAGTGGDSRLLSCGYWDGALKCHALESSTLRLQASTSGGHCGEVTVLQVGGDGQTVVTGGADATCRVWIVDNAGMASALTAEDPLDTNPYIDSTNHANATEQQGGMSAAANDLGLLSSQEENEGKTREVSEDKVEEGEESQLEGGVERLLRCVHILWGHEAPVTALALSTTLDLVVSGAENGHLLLHRVQAGDHVRNLLDSTTKNVGEYGPISMIVISDPLCYVVVHCRESLSLRVFSINGDFLCETKTTQALNAMVVSNVGDLLIVGGDSGVLEIYSIHNLELLRTKSFQSSKAKKGSGSAEESAPSAITALTFGKDYQYLFIGTEAGEVWICTDPRIRLEMLDIAINRTFAGMI